MSNPNLFLIGASKCGTTFLHNVLDQHPDISMSKVKEPCFFSWDDYKKKFDWYLSLFDHCSGAQYVGESSPIYSETTFFSDIPERIYHFNSDARLIYVVREPFSRLASVYKQTMSTGHWAEPKFYQKTMPKDYSDAVFLYPPFLEATKYWTHIKNYLKFFPDQQIKILMFDDLVKDFDGTMKNIIEFLELPSHKFQRDASSRNESQGKKVYNAKYNKFIHLLPAWAKQVVPGGVKRNIRDFAYKLTPSVPDLPELNDDDVQRVKKILEPEVEGLYRYLGITSDPWNFWELNN